MTSAICYCNAKIHAETGPIENGWLTAEGGRITAFAAGKAPENPAYSYRNCNGLHVLPGFVDIHIHGACGHEFMDAHALAFRSIAQHCAQHGVTAFLPTTWSAPQEEILNVLHQLKRTMKEGTGSSRILGAHIEGPYLNPRFSGAQDERHLRPIDEREVQRWLATGIVRLLALAPEIPAAMALIEQVVEEGMAVSAAHSGARFAQLKQAIAYGLKQVTHTFNGMAPLHQREPGILGAALSLKELSCEVIADGIHVHPSLVNLLYQIKSKDRLILITDSVRAAGLPDGSEYEQDGRVVRCNDGAARLADGTLAGSTLTMDRALLNLSEWTGNSFTELWPCASLTPARAIQLDHEIGSIAVGKRADLVLLSAEGQVLETIVAGETVYRATSHH
ncbi:MAG: N-acetylglucosamine-6-phosphate deacetylase [Anaerolineaceae bacterium]|nr:N-acetylglucosamine-6-phosphate deacetylase [Anaerolineaceae bacterium]